MHKSTLFVAITGFVFTTTILFGIVLNPDPNTESPSLTQTTTQRIEIPSIAVDAKIVSVGLTSEGDMDTPKNPSEVAWYNLGPKPGEIGSSVLAGHLDWEKNQPAVFKDLPKLKSGDKIFVHDTNGKTNTFTVRTLQTYKHDQDARDVFISTDGKAHLNLITCTGTWNKQEKTYSDRLIVFADLSE